MRRGRMVMPNGCFGYSFLRKGFRKKRYTGYFQLHPHGQAYSRFYEMPVVIPKVSCDICTMAMEKQKNNPLHGITLETIITRLHAHYGWKELARTIRINSFSNDPSIKSSLAFLRRTPWARKKVEDLYVATFPESPPQKHPSS